MKEEGKERMVVCGSNGKKGEVSGGKRTDGKGETDGHLPPTHSPSIRVIRFFTWSPATLGAGLIPPAPLVWIRIPLKPLPAVRERIFLLKPNTDRLPALLEIILLFFYALYRHQVKIMGLHAPYGRSGRLGVGWLVVQNTRRSVTHTFLALRGEVTFGLCGWWW